MNHKKESKPEKPKTLTEAIIIQNQEIKLLKKEVLGLYIVFTIFWLFVIVETLIEVSNLIQVK